MNPPYINTKCQICEKGKRTQAILYESLLWFLCDRCVEPGSKFVSGINVINSHKDRLNKVMLRDICKSKSPHSGPYDLAFKFKINNSVCMRVPGLNETYHSTVVLRMDTRTLVSIGHDTFIELEPWE